MSGYYRLPLAYALCDLQWNEQRFLMNMKELSKNNMVHYDQENQVIFIRNFLKHNELKSPQQIKGALKHVYEAPASPLIKAFAESFNKHVKGYDILTSELESHAESVLAELNHSGCSDMVSNDKNTLAIPYQYPSDREPPGTGTGTETGTETETGTGTEATPPSPVGGIPETPIVEKTPKRPKHKRPLEGVSYDKLALGVIYEMLDYCPAYMPDAPSEIRLLQELGQEYPNVSLVAEFRRARDWLDNPKSKRPGSDLKKFLRNWISRAANDYGAGQRRIIGYETVTEFIPADEAEGEQDVRKTDSS